MEPIFNVVLPVFAIILCGYGCGYFGLLGEASSEALNRFVYYVALPVMLFYSMARVEPAEIFHWSFIAVIASGNLAIMIVSMIVSKLMFKTRLAEQALFGMVSTFGNTGYMGIPLVIVAFGEAAVLPAIIATVFQSTVLIAVVATLIEVDMRKGQSDGSVAVDVMRAIGRNPLVLSSMAGMAWSFGGLDLPAPIETFCQILSPAAGPGALFAIGLFMVGKPLRRGLGETGVAVVIKLLISPALTWWLVTRVFEVPPTWAAVAVLMAALPAAANCFVLAQNYGVYVQRTSAMILVSTLFAALTVSVLFAMPLMKLP